MKRLVQTQVWPVLRNLLATAPSTAAAMSASSNTRKGALPPSSSDTRFNVGTHCCASSTPTLVDPVKLILRTCGLLVSSPPITLALPVTTLNTPGGMPARCASSASARCGQGRLAGWLADEGAARGQRRAALARDHGSREIPWRDRTDHAHRLAQHEDALVRGVAGDDVAIHALAFLGKPLDERCRVADFAARLGQWLALLGRQQPPQVIRVRDDQVEPAAQQQRAITGRARGPGRKSRAGGSNGATGFGGARAGDLGDGLRRWQDCARNSRAAVCGDPSGRRCSSLP